MGKHIKTSLDYIRRAPFQALAAISILSLTFFVSTFLAIIGYSSHQILRSLETRPQIITFLKQNAVDTEVEALKAKLTADTRVKSLQYVPKEKALQIYKEATADNPLLGELVSPQIFPASIEFSVVDLSFAQIIIDEIKSDPVVDSVSFTASLGPQSLSDVISRLKTIIAYIRIGGIGAAFLLAGTSFLVLTVVIGMRITTRKQEIDTLSLIGATPFFIKSPIIIEALIYSVVGVFTGWLTATVVLMYATPSILRFFGNIPVLPSETPVFFGLLGMLLVVEFFIGIVIAFFGSFTAVSRSLRIMK